jgi:hypothetical protein
VLLFTVLQIFCLLSAWGQGGNYSIQSCVSPVSIPRPILMLQPQHGIIGDGMMLTGVQAV